MTLWLQYFYDGLKKYEDFPCVGTVAAQNKQSKAKTDVKIPSKGHQSGPNPTGVDLLTHCMAYLTYWLCSFAMPCRDETVIHPDTIYPACQMAWGIKLYLCPVALCLIYKAIGDVIIH